MNYKKITVLSLSALLAIPGLTTETVNASKVDTKETSNKKSKAKISKNKDYYKSLLKKELEKNKYKNGNKKEKIVKFVEESKLDENFKKRNF